MLNKAINQSNQTVYSFSFSFSLDFLLKMYYDDIYHPVADDGAIDRDLLSDEDETIISRSYINKSDRARRRKMLEDIKKMDPGYRSFYTYTDNAETNERIRVEVYSTDTTPGVKIRDAITGSRYNQKVGSYDEDLYFKVRMSIFKDNSVSTTLFYDSPEAFERHQHTTVKPEEKERWVEKQQERMYVLRNPVE